MFFMQRNLIPCCEQRVGSLLGVSRATRAGMFPGLGVGTSHQHLLRDLFGALLFIAALHGITAP